MNERNHNRLISGNNSIQSQREAATATDSVQRQDDEQIPTRSTYDSFCWLLNYTKMFASRLANDLFISLLSYFCSGQLIPNHIVDLMRVQKILRAERECHTVTCSSSREHRILSLRLFMSEYIKAFKSCILSSEDDAGLQYTPNKDFTYSSIDREPMFVIVDSSCVSNPSSKELLVDNTPNPRETCVKYFNKNVIPIDVPSTSRDYRNEIYSPQLKVSESRDELQMVDINLQSENEIPVRDNDVENESIVISYLRNKDESIDLEELSETSLDVHIPSYPGSPRSLNFGSRTSIVTINETDKDLRKATDYFHQDNDFLIAAEIGDDKMLEIIISKGTNIQEMDHLGRNALHLAVCSDNERAIILLLQAGVKTNVKDNVGMTPLSLCLMRRPSLKVAHLLFDYGAKILPRFSPMDTGLFLQFVMMCAPTSEEEKILRLLIQKGALVNDPDAPGGRQALHFAAMSNNCDLIEILVELGADLYQVNHRNETPKDVAFTFQCREAYILLEELEEYGSRTTGAVREDGGVL